MAKTESTAVNELIDLVQSGTPPAAEPSADLFGAPPSSMVGSPRLTAPITARHTGELEPLPPRRSPRATSQHSMLPPAVRMSTAEPERGNTIPPLSQLVPPLSQPAARTPRASTVTPVQRPSVPPPIPQRATGALPVQRASSPPPIAAAPATDAMRARRASSPPPIPTRATGGLPVQRASAPPPIPTRVSSSLSAAAEPARGFEPGELASSWTLDDAATPLHAASSFDSARLPLPSMARTDEGASSFDDDHTPLPSASPFDDDHTPVPGASFDDALAAPPHAALSDDAGTPLPIDVAPMVTRRRASSQGPAVTAAEVSSPPPLPRRTSSQLAVARPSASLPPPHRDAPPPHRDAPRGSAPSFRSRPTVPSSASLPMLPSLPSLPPPTAPVAAPFKPASDRSVAAMPHQYPVIKRPRTVDATGDVIRAENWFELSSAIAKMDQADGTAVVPRPQGDTRRMIKRLIVPAILVGIAGGALGAYVAVDRQKASRARTAAAGTAELRHVMPEAVPTPAAPPEPAPVAMAATDPMAAATAATDPAAAASAATDPATTAAAPTAAPAPVTAIATSSDPAAVREVQTPRGVVTLVDVRINSKPAGATVMLVDNGKTSFLGSTPLATSLDPSRRYDVIFTLPGRPTQMAPLDPTKTSTLDVTLGRGKRSRHAEHRAPALARAVVETPAPAPAPAKPTARAKATARHASAPRQMALADPGFGDTAAGDGTLMVSSKPPCEIVIDGKPTGLTTPQRSIALSAGRHKVTFINAPAGIKKTVAVSIRADKPTKLIQDLMKR